MLNSSVISLGDHFIVHSEHNKKVFCKRYKIPGKKVSVIPHGILRPYEQKGITKLQARKKFGLGMKDKVILNFGNIRDYKGVDLLIKAFKELILPGKKLIIAGKCWESKQKYEELIAGDNDIIFKDCFIPTDEIEFYFAACDLVVLPYKYFESASGVASLVLPFHKPMIVSDVGGLGEMVPSGCIVDQLSPENLNEKIIYAIKKSNSLIMKQVIIAKAYQWKKIVDKTIKIYNET
jgi:glycosyltransferase involved in cell wall biosynthesis